MSDTVCSVADSADALKFIDDHPMLKDYLLPTYFPKREAGFSAAPTAQNLLHEGSEKVLFTTPVEHLAGRDVLVISASRPC